MCLPCGMESSELFGGNKKLHEILYHMVNTWNEVVDLFLPLEFVSWYKIMFSVQVFCVLFQPMTNTS